jgi:peptide/nickel transport system permease protein
MATLGAGWVALVCVAAVAAPWIAPYASEDTDLPAALAGPGRRHLLGVDPLGRDELSRLIFGSRVTLEGVGIAVIAFLLVGATVGLVAGYAGGLADLVVSRALDIALAIPAVLVLLTVLSVAPNDQVLPMLAFGALSAPGLARVVRSAALEVREELYVDAARIFGLTPLQIIARHVLRRVVNVAVVQAAIFAGVALIVQSGLAFLGFGPRPPAPSWGSSVQDASEVINRDPWLLYPTGLVIALTVLAFGLVGDGVRDAAAQRWARARFTPARIRAGRRGPAAPPPSSAPGRPLLSVRGLSVDAGPPGRPVRLIDNVSFDIGAGEAVGLVGESGCGKSISALAVLGVLPSGARRVAGSVALDGRDLTGELAMAAARGREIGYISQEPMIALDPTFTAGAQLAEAVRRHRRVSRAAARRTALELLGQVKVRDPEAVAARYPHQLSGGIAQRVCIALALAGEPRLLIADEPTTALDVRVQAEILALLHTLRRETGLAVLLVTHDWGVVADQCDRAVVMYAGEVVEVADVETVFAQPRHPYTQGLLASSRSLSDPDGAPPAIGVAGVPLVTIPGVVPRPGDWPAGCHFQDRCAFAADACRAGPVTLLDTGGGHGVRCIRETAKPRSEAR